MDKKVIRNDENEETNSCHIDNENLASLNYGKATPAGILRVDSGKMRKTSIELRLHTQDQPNSPQPSVDRLSVTFADFTNKSPPETSLKTMEKVHFPSATEDIDNNSDDEDYSESVTAIMQRKASTRRSKKRRGSSPFSPDILPENANDRRRSSGFTISSEDTAITMEDSFTPSITQEQIFENIKLHKEVLSSVKMQPWNMRKKLRLVTQAKSYIKRHEGALQERLAHSHSTKDMLARCNIYMIKKWQRCKREAANISNWLIPWELRIKEIESHFGSVVASYFIFLRWLFWVNIVISIILVAFVAIPEMLTVDVKKDPARKSILPEDKYNATNFLTLWDFEGVFKYSPMFYGWYTNQDTRDKGYRLPLAYFFTGLAVYVFSFVATLRKMAENSRMSKLSEKEDECIFSWKLFTGWDYMIGNAETAHNRVASIVMGFKEALLEEAEKKREAQSWKVIGSRILVNIGVLALLGLSAYAVVTVVDRSNEKEANSTMWRRNEITVVMSLISLSFPMLFEILGYCEHYHPRKQLRLQLARIMVLNLLNLYSLIIALFGKISNMTNDLQVFLDATQNESLMNNTQVVYYNYSSDINYTNCYNNCVKASVIAASLIIVSSTTINPINVTLTGFDENITNLYDGFNESLIYNFNDSSTIDPNVSFTFMHLNDSSSTMDPNISFAFMNLNESECMYEVENSTLEFDLNIEVEEYLNSTELNKNVTSFMFNDSSSQPASSEASTIQSDFTTEISTTSTSTDFSLRCKEKCSNAELNVSYAGVQMPLDYRNRSRLRSLCWETMFGQELVKLTVMDLVLTVLSILAIDFFRGLFVRFMNNCWCWDLEKKFPQYGEFKVAENILHLVNNQGMVWMGMFFSPGLVVLNVFKLYVLMYLRSWAVLTCNVPPEVIFRASRSNNFYFALLLMMLFLCVLPVGYTIVWLKPSWHCGPFSKYKRILNIFNNTIRELVPSSLHRILDYIASPGIVIPLLMLLILIIYYLISLTNALREANNDLKFQLRRERTEERRKMFQFVDRRRRNGSDCSDNTPYGKWKKLLQGLPSGKSLEESPKQESIEVAPINEKEKSDTTSGMLSKFIFKALKSRKQSISEDDSPHTDTDQHESLPDDFTQTKIEPNPSKCDEKHVKIISSNAPPINVTHKNAKHDNVGGERKDSINSNWSEKIPVITISKTESSECILETKTIRVNETKTMESQQVERNDNSRNLLKKQTTEYEGEFTATTAGNVGEDSKKFITKIFHKTSEKT